MTLKRVYIYNIIISNKATSRKLYVSVITYPAYRGSDFRQKLALKAQRTRKELSFQNENKNEQTRFYSS